ncbi:MAG: gliding motility-associated ABC transporter permease subunit GldF [Flavobacteriaceae bacterium]|nr:gliding motility-associated ABC transporter permease subunit GldF [Flavobacteriaceae bacterium]
MKSVFIKEIRGFLSSLIAYVTIAVFLLGIGMFMWVFPKLNVFDNGYANLDTLFYVAPWMFVFLVSAVTMRSFSEEKKSGTLELLTTKPLTDWQIVLAKYFAAVVLVLFSLIPTLLYYYTVYQLGSPAGNVDSGATFGSYIGLFFLGASFAAIGIFSSIVTDNQIVSFILSMFLCFFMHTALTLLADFNLFGRFDVVLEWLSISSHYESMSRGVIDTRDIMYFGSFIGVFLYAGKTVFGSRKW